MYKRTFISKNVLLNKTHQSFSDQLSKTETTENGSKIIFSESQDNRHHTSHDSGPYKISNDNNGISPQKVHSNNSPKTIMYNQSQNVIGNVTRQNYLGFDLNQKFIGSSIEKKIGFDYKQNNIDGQYNNYVFESNPSHKCTTPKRYPELTFEQEQQRVEAELLIEEKRSSYKVP